MYDNLKSLGITNPEEIDSLQPPAGSQQQYLELYFQKDKGEFFTRALSLNIHIIKQSSLMGQGYQESRKSAESTVYH
ncbi:DUF3461 family protein [Escherichia coli]